MYKDESMKWPFKREDMVDNLVEWAEKMKTLGEAWGALSWHVNRYDGDGDALARCGEMLGSIIADYAGLIEDTVNENMSILRNVDKSIVFSLAGCQEVYDFVKDTKRPEDICAIDYRLNELTDFIHNVGMPAVGLKNDFMELRNSIIAKQKSAPAAVAAAAGA